MPTRNCPECGEEMFYRNLQGFLRAYRQQTLCRRCAGSKVGMKRRLATGDSVSATSPGSTFLDRFFELATADLPKSGSATG